MPKGTGRKHSKNAGVMWSEGLSCGERRALGFGTQKQRFGRESMKAFDACSLSLQAARDPVATPDGVVYSKEAILEALVQQKQSKQKQYKQWLQEQEEENKKQAEEAEAHQNKLLSHFHSENHGGNEASIEQHISQNQSQSTSVQTSDSHMTKQNRERASSVKAFWLPSKTPDAKSKTPKPDTETRCPMRGTKLRRKDLVDIKWTHSPGKSHEPMCPLCKRVFTNATTIILIKPTGDCIDEECFKRTVKPDRQFNGYPIKPVRDTIQLERTGTGFAGGGGVVESSKYSSLGAHLSNQDPRGHPGPTSRFGLSW